MKSVLCSGRTNMGTEFPTAARSTIGPANVMLRILRVLSKPL